MVQVACKKQSIDRSDFRFTQRDIREKADWSDYQVKSHLRKLVSLECVLVHHGGRRQQFVYELLYNGEGKDGKKFLMSLIDVDDLKKTGKYNPNREHSKQDRVQKSHGRGHENPDWKVPGSYRRAPGKHG